MEREFSAGGVVVRYADERWWIAAIEPKRSNGERKNSKKRVLALPKGLIDAGEKSADTAVREVREETGIEAALIHKLHDIKYMYVRSWGDKQRVFKVVSFFLLRYRSGTIGDIPPEMKVEVEKAEWIPIEDADKRLSYPGEKQVARIARDYLREHPQPTDEEEKHTAKGD